MMKIWGSFGETRQQSAGSKFTTTVSRIASIYYIFKVRILVSTTRVAKVV